MKKLRSLVNLQKKSNQEINVNFLLCDLVQVLQSSSCFIIASTRVEDRLALLLLLFHVLIMASIISL